MQHKKPEYFEMLERFIDEYKDAITEVPLPSLKEIARNIGLAESTGSKYLKVMRERKASSNVKAGRTLLRSKVGVTQKALPGPRSRRGCLRYSETGRRKHRGYIKLPVALFRKR